MIKHEVIGAIKKEKPQKSSHSCEKYKNIELKYQKIQEIINDWEDGRFSDVVGCLRVKAVLDGNDD